MIGIDLFAGAGGMSLGAVWAGIDVQLAIDIDPYAADTYQCNHPKTKILVTDIRNIKKLSINSKSEPRVLFGGPPCQGFSTSNQRTRNPSNSKNWMFIEFLRLVKQWCPEWVVFENVKGIKETEGGYFFYKIVDELQSYGYDTTSWVLNAVDYGVPQKRSRVFIIGSKEKLTIAPPKQVVTSSEYITVQEAIDDLPVLSNGASINNVPYKNTARSNYAHLMRGDLYYCANHLVSRNAPIVIQRYACIPQGGNWESIPPNLMTNYKNRTRCHTGIYHRLALNEPSVVLGNYRKNMLVHPTQDRGLSVREAARIQSFPDWYEFKGSIGFQQQQVGNSVPPLLAEAVFNTILSRGTS